MSITLTVNTAVAESTSKFYRVGRTYEYGLAPSYNPGNEETTFIFQERVDISGTEFVAVPTTQVFIQLTTSSTQRVTRKSGTLLFDLSKASVES